MSRRTERVRPWEERPKGPERGDHVPADRAYVERMMSYRWDQYKHGETGFGAVWFYVSWWLVKVHALAFIIGPVCFVGTFLLFRALT